MHGNNKSPAELNYAIERGIGHIVVDSFDEIERLRSRSQRVMLRVTPGIEPSTHSYIQTGQVDSKFGFGSRRFQGGRRCAAAGLELCGLHAHIGSQIFELEAFEKARRCSARWGTGRLNLGGGLGIAYTREDGPALDRGVRGGAPAPRARRGDRAERARPGASGTPA